MPIAGVPSSVEKYQKIKYAIFDRPHNLEMDHCDTFKLILNGSY
jgi:hypothetical protein